jgi:hypothetical protein
MPSTASKTTGCNTECSGDSSEKCGGNWKIGVYKFTCSGTPVPRPKAKGLMNNPCTDDTQPFVELDLSACINTTTHPCRGALSWHPYPQPLVLCLVGMHCECIKYVILISCEMIESLGHD